MVASITITLDEQGRVEVSAPFANKLLCYGLLQTALEVVKEQSAVAQRLIQPASRLDLGAPFRKD